ncbi:5-dehydro-4-deoxyglucarate dehydratase [Burkholderiales bacterium]|nr:MAG: 5-dehydro-4-deoxyglucarate dehydratase [Burkholderiales bacterium]CAG1011713.1 5-dehydro-4-deoxyglucarate dehydratase [Burkholderiales bacterium]
MSLDHQELKAALSSGLLSFPITDFDAQSEFDEAGYRRRLEWLLSYRPAGLFAAGGTGEFFSLDLAEYRRIIAAAVAACKGKAPVVAGVGYSTRMAIAFAQEAERQGADGILILPHYLTEADQEGVRRHVTAICRSVKIAALVYNRGVCRLDGEHVERIAADCPNLVGFKDGIGDADLLLSVRCRLGERLMYLGGMPTAEVFAMGAKAMGVSTYSSAVFNFAPDLAMRFYHAVRADDRGQVDRLLATFYLPLLKIRNRRPGYAVSMIKAGCRLVGKGGGAVRPPLVDLSVEEHALLETLLADAGVIAKPNR